MGFPIHQIFVRLGLDTKGLKPAIGGAVKQFSQMGNSLQMAGIRAGFMFTAPIMLAAKASFKAVAEFDRNMTRSTAIMGDLSKAMREDMVASAKTVARDIPKSAAEVAEGFFFLASAGLDAEQSIAAMPAVAKFAVAGAFDLARATSLAADAQSSLGLKSSDAAENLENLTRVTDVLVKANTLANATTEQFSRALTTKAGAAIKIVNKEMEEGVAVLAAFADQGIKAENAGTALNIVFRDLKTKGLKNRVEWQKFGGVFDSVTGKMRPMADIIGSMEEGLEGMSPKMVQAQLKLLGFSDKSLVFTQALIGMSEKIRQYEKDLKLAGGTTADVADKQVKNIGDQMAIAKQKIGTAAIALGNSLMPAFEALIGVLGAFEGAIHAVAAAMEIPFLGKFLQGLATLLAVIGPLLIALSMLAFAIKGVKFAIDLLSLSVKKFWIALGVLGAAIVGIGLIYSAFKKDTKEAGDSQQQFNDILADAKSRAAAATTALSDYQMAARIGTVTIRTFKNAEKALKDLQQRHEQLPDLIVQNQDEQRKLTAQMAEGGKKTNWFGATLGDLQADLVKLQRESEIATAKEKAFEEVIESMAPKVEFAKQAMTGAERAAKQMGAEIESTAFANALLEKATHDLNMAMTIGGDAFSDSAKELKMYESKLRAATTGLAMMEKAENKLMTLAFVEDLEGQRDLVADLTKTVKKLRDALGIKEKAVIDRESLTMLEDAKREMTGFVATASALNAIAGFSPGSPMITGMDMAKEKVKILEDELGNLMERAVEKSAEVGGLAEVWKLPEFSEQLNGIAGQLVEQNELIANGEAIEAAKEHWEEWAAAAIETKVKVAEAWTGFFDDFTSGWGQAVGAAIVHGESFGDAMQDVWKNMAGNFISAIAEMVMQWIIGQFVTQTAAGATHGVMVANATQIAAMNAYAGAAWIPGAGAIAAAAAITGVTAAGLAGRAAGTATATGSKAFEQAASNFGVFAEGGIVTNPTLALIGEAGPEAVVPLSGRHGLGGSQHINLYMDGQLVTETVLRNMPDEVRLNIGAQI